MTALKIAKLFTVFEYFRCLVHNGIKWASNAWERMHQQKSLSLTLWPKNGLNRATPIIWVGTPPLSVMFCGVVKNCQIPTSHFSSQQIMPIFVLPQLPYPICSRSLIWLSKNTRKLAPWVRSHTLHRTWWFQWVQGSNFNGLILSVKILKNLRFPKIEKLFDPKPWLW